MQNASLPLLPFRSKDLPIPVQRPVAGGSFFHLQALGEILRSLFLSSALWIFLAFTIYIVYTLFASPR